MLKFLTEAVTTNAYQLVLIINYLYKINNGVNLF